MRRRAAVQVVHSPMAVDAVGVILVLVSVFVQEQVVDVPVDVGARLCRSGCGARASCHKDGGRADHDRQEQGREGARGRCRHQRAERELPRGLDSEGESGECDHAGAGDGREANECTNTRPCGETDAVSQA